LITVTIYVLPVLPLGIFENGSVYFAAKMAAAKMAW